jgi:hypothetical protein
MKGFRETITGRMPCRFAMLSSLLFQDFCLAGSLPFPPPWQKQEKRVTSATKLHDASAL